MFCTSVLNSRHYLTTGICKEVVVVQMRDREGFAELLRLLHVMDMQFELIEIEDELYDNARKIWARAGNGANIGAGRTEQDSDDLITVKQFVFPEELFISPESVPVVDPAVASAAGPLGTAGLSCRKSRCRNTAVRDADGTNGAPPSNEPALNPLPHKINERRAILRTAKENFVILKIFRKSVLT
jgi:hypothetical protein